MRISSRHLTNIFSHSVLLGVAWCSPGAVPPAQVCGSVRVGLCVCSSCPARPGGTGLHHESSSIPTTEAGEENCCFTIRQETHLELSSITRKIKQLRLFSGTTSLILRCWARLDLSTEYLKPKFFAIFDRIKKCKNNICFFFLPHIISWPHNGKLE